MTAVAHPTPGQLVTPATTAVAAAGYVGVVAAIDPFQPMALGCPIHAMTGGFCPGCGSTRAVHELLHGDVVGSLTCHPMVLPLVGLVVYLWASWIARRRGGRRWALSATQLPATVPVLIAVAFVVLTIVRNVPGWEWLTPPDVAP